MHANTSYNNRLLFFLIDAVIAAAPLRSAIALLGVDPQTKRRGCVIDRQCGGNALPLGARERGAPVRAGPRPAEARRLGVRGGVCRELAVES